MKAWIRICMKPVHVLPCKATTLLTVRCYAHLHQPAIRGIIDTHRLLRCLCRGWIAMSRTLFFHLAMACVITQHASYVFGGLIQV